MINTRTQSTDMPVWPGVLGFIVGVALLRLGERLRRPKTRSLRG